jgi:hypothetical protein
MHLKPGLQVVRVGQRGTGQVVGLDGADALVFWQRGGKRERLPQSELVWVGLTIHTRDGRPAKVTILGRVMIRVRFPDGTHCWMNTDEVAPRPSEN